MGRQGQRRKYIRNVARTWMERYKIRPEDFHGLHYLQDIAKKLKDTYGDAFYWATAELNDETLGKLVACGQPDSSGRLSTGMGASLDDINSHRPNWISGRWSGLSLLHLLASSAILAEVCNRIIEQHPSSQKIKQHG